MACLNLSNGPFVALTWSDAATANTGDDVTIQRTATQITVQKVGFNSLVLNGDFSYAIFGADNFIALLKLESSAVGSTRTVFVVDITGGILTLTQIFQILLPSSQSLPTIAHSPGSGRLAFFWTGTGTPNDLNEVRDLRIVRSDDGSPVLSATSDPPRRTSAPPSGWMTAMRRSQRWAPTASTCSPSRRWRSAPRSCGRNPSGPRCWRRESPNWNGASRSSKTTKVLDFATPADLGNDARRDRCWCLAVRQRAHNPSTLIPFP